MWFLKNCDLQQIWNLVGFSNSGLPGSDPENIKLNSSLNKKCLYYEWGKDNSTIEKFLCFFVLRKNFRIKKNFEIF